MERGCWETPPELEECVCVCACVCINALEGDPGGAVSLHKRVNHLP